MKVLFLFTVCLLVVYGHPRSKDLREDDTNRALIRNNRIIRNEIQPMPKVGGDDEKDCLDRTGKIRKDKEDYKCPWGQFKLRCNKGQEEVTGCIGSDRANKEWLKLGETLNKNGFWHKCERFDNGSVIYHQELSCLDGRGKELHLGEELTVASLRLKCVAEGYQPIGCLVQSKSGDVALDEGEEKDLDGFAFKCHTSILHREKRGIGNGSYKQIRYPEAEDLYTIRSGKNRHNEHSV
ncbi:unnamed protein product [Bursaphelenchus okinawaensis]|uniref:Uncharacterized protein n=1 Tax=Bursaphelenchus okinawaensis TaxID=465554 RepID=A0A811K658_9BILA|nr:unnamed protein product [Bursaphelenchus okinawaensis]CAG9092187.1 unnamed protein product [Bursaphelenchus okinawaensis]